MLKEKRYLAKHPFEIWKSEEVANLLIDFYEANFTKAGLRKGLGKELVSKVWKEKGTVPPEALRKECDAIFLQAKAEVKNQPGESDPLDIIDFDGVKKFLDIGANKLATINHYAQNKKSVEQFVGVDVIPQRNAFVCPEKCVYFQVDPEAKTLPIENHSIDLVNIQFLFHHLSDLTAIRKILETYREVIVPQGRIALWEESFTDEFDFPMAERNGMDFGIKTDKELTERFYSLNEEKRREFVMANDWLINVNNPQTIWTGQYYAWPEWISLLREFGFVLEKQYNFGLRINGRLKQGVHMMGIFRSSH